MNKRKAKKRKLLYAMCDDAGVLYNMKCSWKNLRLVNKDYTRFCNEYKWCVADKDNNRELRGVVINTYQEEMV